MLYFADEETGSEGYNLRQSKISNPNLKTPR
jgi:hypothetical protein